MKKITMFLAFFMMFSLLTPLAAQKSEKKAKKELQKKSMKMAKKEAKKLRRQGYHVAPGALPIDKQLERAYIKQYMEDEQGYPLYIIATGNSVAGTQTAARIQATETAKLTLAGTLSTEIASLIQNDIANSQITREEAATVTKTVAASKNIIAQELGRVIPLSELYRNVNKDNVECDIIIAYNSEEAKNIAKKVIKEELEKKGEELQNKIDSLLKF
jgi:hypothetical protein